MSTVVENARQSFMRASDSLARRLSDIPDERVNWSPSPTARTPVEIVAHAAFALGNINDMLRGNRFGIKTSEEADVFFRSWESEFKSREQAMGLLQENSRLFLEWLDTVNEDQLDQLVPLPFGLGEAPLGAALSAAADHTQFHVAQLDYVQTIYGDRDWHM